MKMNERQQQIFEMVQQEGRIRVQKLAKTLYVSEMTIRRDLKEMEKTGLLKRYHGGAVSKVGQEELPVSQRVYLNEEEKRVLGKKAEKYLQDHISVFIDSSTTCSYIIPFMKKYNDITMVTNSVKSLIYASQYHIPCILIGGSYYERDMCLVGPLAQSAAEKLNVDVAFYSTQALSDDGWITNGDLAQNEIREVMMRHAKKNIFLFERSNLHRKSLYTLCMAEQADDILFPFDNETD